MSIENYAVHIAPKAGKIDLIVTAMAMARHDAIQARSDYARSRGAVGVYASEKQVAGLCMRLTDAFPPGAWKVVNTDADSHSIVPAKGRTAETRSFYKKNCEEFLALPKLPDSIDFTQRIGSSHVSVFRGGRHYIAACFYERIGGTTFVCTPWYLPNVRDREGVESLDMDGRFDENTRVAFHPEGCVRVGLSVYFAAKEERESHRSPKARE